MTAAMIAVMTVCRCLIAIQHPLGLKMHVTDVKIFTHILQQALAGTVQAGVTYQKVGMVIALASYSSNPLPRDLQQIQTMDDSLKTLLHLVRKTPTTVD